MYIYNHNVNMYFVNKYIVNIKLLTCIKHYLLTLLLLTNVNWTNVNKSLLTFVVLTMELFTFVHFYASVTYFQTCVCSVMAVTTQRSMYVREGWAARNQTSLLYCTITFIWRSYIDKTMSHVYHPEWTVSEQLFC